MNREAAEAMVAQVAGQLLAVKPPGEYPLAAFAAWATDRARNICTGILGNYLVVPLPEEPAGAVVHRSLRVTCIAHDCPLRASLGAHDRGPDCETAIGHGFGCGCGRCPGEWVVNSAGRDERNKKESQ